MSKPASNKSTASKKSGSPMLMGILAGMILGVSMAAGLAWFILKSPSPFVNKATVEKPIMETVPPALSTAPKVQAPAQGSAEGDEAKPRFEFYKVLTDKTDTAVDAPAKPGNKPDKPAAKSGVDAGSVASQPTYLQAGAFSNADDAENLKATLAMKGLVATVQTVTIPGKGEVHRVRLGPFTNDKEMTNARGTLKLNGLDATPTH